MKRALLICVLALASMNFVCTAPPWVSVAEDIAKIAIPITESIVVIADPALAGPVKIVGDVLNALVVTFDTYKATPNATNLAAVVSAFNSVNTNVSQLEEAAQIKNPNTTEEVKGIIGLLTTAVSSIAAQIPQGQLAAAKKVGITVSKPGLTAKDIKNAYNKLVKSDSRMKQL